MANIAPGPGRPALAEEGTAPAVPTPAPCPCPIVALPDREPSLLLSLKMHFFFPHLKWLHSSWVVRFPVLLADSLSQCVTRTQPLPSPGLQHQRTRPRGYSSAVPSLHPGADPPLSGALPALPLGEVLYVLGAANLRPTLMGLERPKVGTHQLSAQPSARRGLPCCGLRGRPLLPGMELAPLNPGVKGSALFTRQPLPPGLLGFPSRASQPLAQLLPVTRCPPCCRNYFYKLLLD